MDGALVVATVAGAVGAGAVGGVFLGFSTFVMAALGRLADDEGAAAMQAINVTAVRPPFMAALFGTAAVCLGLGVAGLTSVEGSAGVLLEVGAVVYLAGVVALTIGFHVPRNDALAAVDPRSAEGAEVWRGYRSSWTAGNHVRALAGLVTCACFVAAVHVA